MVDVQARAKKHMFVFEMQDGKQLVVATDFPEELAELGWFRQFLGLKMLVKSDNSSSSFDQLDEVVRQVQQPSQPVQQPVQQAPRPSLQRPQRQAQQQVQQGILSQAEYMSVLPDNMTDELWRLMTPSQQKEYRDYYGK